MYLTAIYGVIDPAAGTLVYSNAGHPHAFVVHGDGAADRLRATDPPMGFAGADSYREETVRWHTPGDVLLLFTDGLPDSLTGLDRLGAERALLQAVARNRRRPVGEIVDALFALSSDQEPSPLGDDRTALVLRR
jgi:sigma-B regulation protein RsbU (phosphoserine phosphatase)